MSSASVRLRVIPVTVVFLSSTCVSLAAGWRQGPTAPAGLVVRDSHAMAYDSARGRVVLFGGEYGVVRLNDTWEYDGTSWIRGPSAPPALSPRLEHAMAFDSVRRRVVLFGGVDDSFQYRNDTWEYDGAAWILPAQSPLLPPARGQHTMAHDASRQRIVLFGGWDGTIPGIMSDTWELGGSGGWVQTTSAPAPMGGRHLHAMAYDSMRRRTVVFGGDDGTTGFRNDTWEFDGLNWAAGAPASSGLTPRAMLPMVYDAERRRSVIFGGEAPSLIAETWEDDGASWTQGPDPSAAPWARIRFAMAYDAARARVVLFGGYAMTDLNDTWEYGPAVDHVVGEGLGQPNPNRVKVYTGAGGSTSVNFLAYAAGQWGVNVASGDVNGGLAAEILTGPGPGASLGPQVRGFLAAGTAIAKINYFAYGTLNYGVNVAAGNIDSDAYHEIITGPGPGPAFGPQVRAFNFDNSAITAIAKVNYYAYSTLNYGVNVTTGDVDRDLYAEILTGPGPSAAFGPQVRGWNFDGATLASIAKINFNAFGVPQYGVNVAGGDVDADAFHEIACAPGPGAGSSFPSRFKGYNYDGAAIASLLGFDATPFTTTYGGRVGLGDVNGDGGADLLAGAGRDPAADSRVRSYRYAGSSLALLPGSFVPFGTATYGVNVTGGDLGQ